MPRYDYRCLRCGEVFETSHPMAGPGTGCVQCPACGTGHTQKIILQAPAIRIWWQDARSSPTGDASGMKPMFLPSVKNKKVLKTPDDFGGV